MPKKANMLAVALEITGEKPQARRESDNKFSVRLARAIVKVEEDEWDELPFEVQAWFNESAHVLNDNRPEDIEPFPGLSGTGESDSKEEIAPRKTRGGSEAKGGRRSRRGSKAKEETPEDTSESVTVSDLKKGDEVTLTRARGSVSGKVVSIMPNSENLKVEDEDGKVTRVAFSSIKGVKILDSEGGGGNGASGAGLSVEDLEEGAFVVITDNKGKEVTGEVVGVTSRAVVVFDEDEDKEVRISKSKIETVVDPDADPEPEPEPEPEKKPRRSRRSSKAKEGAAETKKSPMSPIEALCADVAANVDKDEDELIDTVLDGLDNDELEEQVVDLVNAVKSMADSMKPKEEKKTRRGRRSRK